MRGRGHGGSVELEYVVEVCLCRLEDCRQDVDVALNGMIRVFSVLWPFRMQLRYYEFVENERQI